MNKAILVILLFTISCTNTNSMPIKEKQKGGFRIIELKYRDHVEYVNLLVDYHFIIDWDLGENSPDFYVFNRKAGSRFKTKSWEKFVDEIQK